MVIESPITIPSETNILQNFSDATAGRSLQLFIGMGTTDSSGVDYVLARDSGVSRPTVIDASAIDVDFDITINKPTIIAGILTIDCRFGQKTSGASANYYIEFKIIHYDGSTETVLGTVRTETLATDSQERLTVKVQTSLTKKLFGIGDILRVNVVGFRSGGSNILFWINPNVAGDEFKIWMPIVNLE